MACDALSPIVGDSDPGRELFLTHRHDFGAGRALPSATTLRWFNELPVVLLVAIVYLVLAKPF